MAPEPCVKDKRHKAPEVSSCTTSAVAMGAVRTYVKLVSIAKVGWNEWPKVPETNEPKVIVTRLSS